MGARIEGVTQKDIILTKADCYKAGHFEVIDLLPKQIQALHLLQQSDISEILYGGAAGGGKSFLGCEWLLWNCIAFPGTRWFIGRLELQQIRESTIETFRKVCTKHKIPPEWYRYNEQSVKLSFANGSAIKGLDLAFKPSDPDYHALGSMEYTGGWIEEAGEVPEKAYEILNVRIGRHLNDQYGIAGKLLITCNPSKNFLYRLFYKPSLEGSLADFRAFIQSFIQDNTKRESGYIERLNRLEGQARERLLLGNWDYESDPLALCDYSAIVDLFTNDYLYPDESQKHMVCDIAMQGSDIYRIGVFYGPVLVDHKAVPKSGGYDVIREAKAMQAKHGIRASNIVYDAVGVGAFVGGRGGFIPNAIPFHGSAAPIKDKDGNGSEYLNLRAQCYYDLANAINEGRIWAKAVSGSDIQTLSEELSQVKKDREITDGKLRIMLKEQVRQNLGRSPDFADIFMMSRYFEIVERTRRKFQRPASMA